MNKFIKIILAVAVAGGIVAYVIHNFEEKARKHRQLMELLQSNKEDSHSSPYVTSHSAISTPSYRTQKHTSSMEKCPACSGRGTNTGTIPCGLCQGKGKVTREVASQMRHVMRGGSTEDFYPGGGTDSRRSSGKSNNGQRMCRNCVRGHCSHCHGLGVVKSNKTYYNRTVETLTCPMCKGTKVCQVCHGHYILN